MRSFDKGALSLERKNVFSFGKFVTEFLHGKKFLSFTLCGVDILKGRGYNEGMKFNRDLTDNTVRADNQVREKCKLHIEEGAAFRVLFLGNSITLHEEAPAIGWNQAWGMAASAEEKDYVHLVLGYLRERYGKVSYCVCNVGEWEQKCGEPHILDLFDHAKGFPADLVISRLGENVNRQRYSVAEFVAAYRKFLAYFQGESKQVIVTDLFWAHEEMDREIQALCKEEGYDFVSVADLGYDERNKAIGLFAHRGVSLHPNDRGMKNIAERIIARIKEGR